VTGHRLQGQCLRLAGLLGWWGVLPDHRHVVVLAQINVLPIHCPNTASDACQQRVGGRHAVPKLLLVDV
jgi:hypothetical protein